MVPKTSTSFFNFLEFSGSDCRQLATEKISTTIKNKLNGTNFIENAIGFENYIKILNYKGMEIYHQINTNTFPNL